MAFFFFFFFFVCVVNSQGAWRPVHKGGVFDGLIDDVSIWSRVLHPDEIKASMFRRPTGKEPGLAAYWGMNEGNGKVVHDASPNKNHGQIFGSPRWAKAVAKPFLESSIVETM